MNKIKISIKAGADLNATFSLPCVKAIHKVSKGNALIELYGEEVVANTATTAHADDYLCMYDNGQWIVK